MEACALARHWLREVIALGHKVRPMPAVYLNSGKTDSADAEAI